MSGALITLTDAGRAALVNPDNTGTVLRRVAQIGVATASFAPASNLVALPNELKRLITFSGDNIAPDTVHVSIRDDSADQYTMYGLGLYLDNGVLLGTYSQATPIMEKSPVAFLLLAADMQFSTINAAALTFGDTQFTNPPATETKQGIIEIATQAETDAGTDDTRAVTPKKLAARTATSTRAGVVELATDAEAQTGTDTTRAITPANLSARTATETRSGMLEIATQAETDAGADDTRAITPKKLAARTATSARAGVVELATDAEAQTGTDTTKAITPANLSARTATETRSGMLEIATQAEANAGVDDTRAITPKKMSVAVANAIAALVNSSPATLDTLSELAASLGNDPNFATTMVNALAGKANLSGATFSGNIGINTAPDLIPLNVKTTGSGAQIVAQFGNSVLGSLQLFTDSATDWGFNALNSRNFLIKTNQVERMRVADTGELLVGQSVKRGTVPTKLQVHDSRISISAADNGILGGIAPASKYSNSIDIEADPDNTAANSFARVTIDGAEVARFTNAKKFGLGTSNPTYKFVVSNDGANGLEIDPTAGSGGTCNVLSYNRSTNGYTSLNILAGDITASIGGNPAKMFKFNADGNFGVGMAPEMRLDVAGGIRAEYRAFKGGRNSTYTSTNWFKVGTITLSDSMHAQITVHGANGYGGGDNVAGKTCILLRGDNLLSGSIGVEGYFYGHTQGRDIVSSVALERVGTSRDYIVYLKPSGQYHSLACYVDTNGSWVADDVDTGSTEIPSGGVLLGSFFTIATSGVERSRVDSNGNTLIATTVHDGVSKLQVNGYISATTPLTSDNSTKVATTAHVANKIAELINSAPGALDTLNELAEALGNDPDFATTMTNALASKAPIASPALTGSPTAPTPATADSTTKVATTAFVKAQNYAPLASPALSGTPTAPTPAAADNTTKVATTAFVKAQNYAPLASPALSGTPTAPTAAAGTSTTQLATTAFMQAALNALGSHSLFAGSNANPGFQKFPGGLMLQWGTNANLGINTSTSRTFPVAFPNQCFHVFITNAGAGAWATNSTWNITTTGYTEGTGNNNTTGGSHWLAIGY